MTDSLAVIQARTGSTRLPGKVMYPLNGLPALEHVISRTSNGNNVTDVVLATTTESQDDVIAQHASKFGANVIRGSESNVISRFERAVAEYDPDIIIRITGDCPLIDSSIIDRVVASLSEEDADYSSNIIHRTFPRGLDVEAFTVGSFKTVISQTTSQIEREHVTPYYRENMDEFEIVNVTSDQVFDDEKYIGRTDLRLTLDEADDYNLLDRIYNSIEYDDILPVRDAIDLIDAEGLAEINESVRQKNV